MHDSAADASARFGLPVEWGHYHTKWHICVDGRNYSGNGCLVTDPTMERAARMFMERMG